MQHVWDLFGLYYDYVVKSLLFLFRPGNRLFALYLLSALIVCFFVYKLSTHHTRKDDDRGFVAFLFPKEVWSHPSAWLDLRYFFFHTLIGHFVLAGTFVACQAWAYSLVSGGLNLAATARIGDQSLSSNDFLIAFVYMIVFFAITDFTGWFAHYLQHKVPILWEFHKVHHSAEVMHPVSNFREHPIDNLFYSVLVGSVNGLTLALTLVIFGYFPSMPMVLGVPLIAFTFNLVGYNLRHSHVWLRWPGVWSKVFPSPAHHHVHHSCHPNHWDKNFAFMFPVWDVIFKTYEMPADNKDVKFGVTGVKHGEMDSCLKLYYVPFKKAFARLRKKSPAQSSPASDNQPVRTRA